MNAALVELDDGWSTIEKGAIQRIQSILEQDLVGHKFDNADYMKYYTLVYNMCTQKPPHNYSEQLYDRYQSAITDYLNLSVLPSVREKTGLYMLHEVDKRWRHHKINVRWMKQFFCYLDRFHTKRLNLPTMREVGMTCFKMTIHEVVKADVRCAVLALIQQEREGGTVEHGLLKRIVEIFVEMGMDKLEVYQRDFEVQFLEETSAFYAREAQRWVQEDGLPDYLAKAENRIRLEVERVSNYLHQSTEQKLLKVVNKELLEVHQQQLMEKEKTGLSTLLQDDKISELARLYRLYSKLPTGLLANDENRYGLMAVSKMVKQHIENVGSACVRSQIGQTSGEGDFVDQLIALHSKYAKLVTICFQDNPLFQKALKEAHETFMNIELKARGECKKKGYGRGMSEMLAAYCDNILKKGSVKLEEDQIEERLDEVVQLFSYLQDKDMFNEYYRKALAKRLLNDKSASDELERSLISKLKLRCGQQFTTKLDGMITDISLAADLKKKYELFRDTDVESSLVADMSVTVLTTGFWPSYKTDQMALPTELIPCLASFERFYETYKKHTKLTWLHTLGHAMIDVRFTSGKKKLEVSMYQGAIILLFNEKNVYTFEEIQRSTQLSAEDLKRYLISLSCGKSKVLRKGTKGPQVDDSETFKIDWNYKDKKARIKFPMIKTEHMKAKDRVEAESVVHEDRKHAIEAAIVRTMKMRKVMMHNQLVMEVISQLNSRFKPDPRIIRKRIEDLIVREYLERDQDDMQKFRYLA